MKEAGESSKEVPSGTCEKVKVLARPTLFSILLKAPRPPQPDCGASLACARLRWAGGEKTNPTSKAGILGHQEDLATTERNLPSEKRKPGSSKAATA